MENLGLGAIIGLGIQTAILVWYLAGLTREHRILWRYHEIKVDDALRSAEYLGKVSRKSSYIMTAEIRKYISQNPASREYLTKMRSVLLKKLPPTNTALVIMLVDHMTKPVLEKRLKEINSGVNASSLPLMMEEYLLLCCIELRRRAAMLDKHEALYGP